MTQVDDKNSESDRNEGRTLGADYASWARINLACAPDVASRIVERVLGLL